MRGPSIHVSRGLAKLAELDVYSEETGLDDTRWRMTNAEVLLVGQSDMEELWIARCWSR